MTIPSAEDDRTLVRRFQAGEDDAFVELMRRHEGRVYNLAYRMLGGPEEARDAAQDAFLACYRNLGRFRGESSFTTWLHRVAVNACYDVLRRRHPTASLDEELTEPAPAPDHADRAVLAADIQRGLLKIPAEFRAVLILFEVQDLSIEDVATALGIPAGTVKSRLHRGRVALGRALGAGGGSAVASTEPPFEQRPTRTPDPAAGEPAAPAGPSKGPNP